MMVHTLFMKHYTICSSIIIREHNKKKNHKKRSKHTISHTICKLFSKNAHFPPKNANPHFSKKREQKPTTTPHSINTPPHTKDTSTKNTKPHAHYAHFFEFLTLSSHYNKYVYNTMKQKSTILCIVCIFQKKFAYFNIKCAYFMGVVCIFWKKCA